MNLNDFVMINTGDVFSIGRVLDLHDLGPYPDRYRAKIHWLYKHEDLIRLIPDCTLEKRPNELFIPAFDPERKPFKGSVEVIDAETIDDVCTVKFLNEKQGFPRPGTAFYVKFAFDENYKVYSAGTYIKMLEEALRDSEASIQKNKCRTPRLSSSGK